jgi:membrane protein
MRSGETRPPDAASASAPRQRARAWRRCLSAAGRVGRVLATSADRYFADSCPQHAAGIAYRVLFSIVPLAIVLVSLFGLVLGNRRVNDLVVDTIVSALPATAASRSQVAEAITVIASPSSGLGLVTLVLFVWAATGMMASIRAGLEVAMHVERSRPMVRGKLVDLVLVFGTAVLVLVTVGVTLLDKLAQHALRRVDSATGLEGALASAWIPRGLALAASVAVVMLLYRFVPYRRLRLADALAGAITTAILLFAISLASSLLYNGVTRLSVVYGSLTAALVFLYSVYLYASALLFGGQVAAAWAAPPEAGGDPLGVQLRRALRGLFVTPGKGGD